MTTEFNFINEIPAQPENEDYDDDRSDICEGCGRDINGYDGADPCPLCCSHSFAGGSEECDWCAHSAECFQVYHKRGLA